jgi:hypothetical protein
MKHKGWSTDDDCDAIHSGWPHVPGAAGNQPSNFARAGPPRHRTRRARRTGRRRRRFHFVGVAQKAQIGRPLVRAWIETSHGIKPSPGIQVKRAGRLPVCVSPKRSAPSVTGRRGVEADVFTPSLFGGRPPNRANKVAHQPLELENRLTAAAHGTQAGETLLNPDPESA